MNKPRECGCKGCRTCLLCEEKYGIGRTKPGDVLALDSYVYCRLCEKAWPGWVVREHERHPEHSGNAIEYPGVFVAPDFLDETEATRLVSELDELPWDLSQSGRRKQNFGPKCNFKKRRLRPGHFAGFPKCTKFLQDRFESVDLLRDFHTIEQCTLEYDPERGASIDPHIDDCWIWGERVVTVNLLGDSVLTMTGNLKHSRYNLSCVETYPSVVERILGGKRKTYELRRMSAENEWPVVRIPMPARSLLIIYGSPRYDWEHQVLREDVKSRRLCLAYREFTPPYLPGGSRQEEGADILERARNFW